MPIAAIYDIHGNIDALDAVLQEVRREGIDRIVIGGDLAWGPFPAEVVARIRNLDQEVIVIRGNADRELAARADEADGLEAWVAEVNAWCADQLSSEERGFLASLPETSVLSVEGAGEILFCHATPRSDEEIITDITPDDEVGTVLADVEQHVVVCGHTHSQFDRVVGDHRVVNAGSVGLPYEDAPGAYWAILGPDVTLRRTEYDFADAATRIRRSSCPDGEGFADAITSPLSRSTATETFEERRANAGT
jgi:putative phosphoesterase